MTNDIDAQSLSDEDLIILTLENANHFSYIVERYQAKLLFYICRISGVSHEDAEDMLQEIFLKMYSNMNSFTPGLKFSSWVYRIAHNHVISSFRKKKRGPRVSLLMPMKCF
jgi:RNA polymerase sigma factor (sigma-70 family)